MTVLNYIREQKRKLERKHAGETYVYFSGEEPMGIDGVSASGGQTAVEPETVEYGTTARTAWDILREIDAMQGFNVREREQAHADYCRKKYGKTVA